MSYQVTIDAAIEQGRRGMALAGEKAGTTFAVEAFAFLTRFVETAERPFSSEEVTGLAATCGLMAPDARAWGAVFQRAARAGVIKRSRETYQRRYGHGSVGVKRERAL